MDMKDIRNIRYYFVLKIISLLDTYIYSSDIGYFLTYSLLKGYDKKLKSGANNQYNKYSLAAQSDDRLQQQLNFKFCHCN